MADAFSKDNPGNSVTVKCPACQHVVVVPSARFGKPFRCTQCGKNLQVRAPRTGPVPVVSPPPIAPRQASGENQVPQEFAVPRQENPAPRKRRPKASVVHWLMLALIWLLAAGMLVSTFVTSRMVKQNELVSPDIRAELSEAGNRPEDSSQQTGKSGATKGVNARSPTAHFPRRALLIAINEYLYANPLQQGAANSWKGLDKLGRALQVGLRYPSSQIAHISDAIPGGPIPLKKNLEKAIEEFLSLSRKQDSALVWFTGHGAVIEGKAYLAPLEGDLSQPSTLIPLDWVMEKLKSSPARQKVLVLDVFRFNPVIGQERPGSDPMPENFEKLAISPPAGVEVVLGCGKGQNSFEIDEAPMGLLPLALYEVLNQIISMDSEPQNPVDWGRLLVQVNQGMNANARRAIPPLAERLESTKRDGKSVEMLVQHAGKPAENGVAYDPAEPAAPMPDLAREKTGEKMGFELNGQVLRELDLPPVKRGRMGGALHADTLPVLDAKAVAAFIEKGDEGTPLRKAMLQSQVDLWALSGLEPPMALKEGVMRVRQDKKITLETLVDFYGKPANETRFKEDVERNQKQVATIFALVEGDLETLKELADGLEKEPLRYQAHFQFLKARLEAQIAYLYEYQSALGSIRKELPALEKGHSGWRLASSTKLRGDRAGKQMEKDRNADLKKLVDKYPNSPWAVLARRDMLTSLGLEWQSAVKRE